MELFQFGDSRIQTTRIGLGLAALGRPGYINLGHGDDLSHNYDEKVMESQTHEMLDEAFRLGIRYVDAAQSYGKSEEFLSSWLAENAQHDLMVGSKWGYYYTADWSVDADKHEIKEHTLPRLNLQWPESKSRLAPYLKLYQIHSATFESGVLKNTQVLERLEEIKSEGYIIGLSVSGAQQAAIIQEALKVTIDEQPLFGSVQATFNCLEQSAGDALREAHDFGLGVIVKEAVANGRLTARNEKANYFKVLDRIAKDHEVGIDAVAMAFVLDHPFVNVVLSGAAKESHLRSNVQALDIQLTSKEKDILNVLKTTPENYWQERSGLSWN
ncbi:MAG: aldo/keto reductase [Cyclobacteriaceae bacterium]